MTDGQIHCNLTVVRSADLERAARFYEALGLQLTKHAHGSGPTHLAHKADGHTFEIYPLKGAAAPTTSTRIGFRVPSVDEAYARLLAAGGTETSAPQDSEWGRRAVVTDPDGHRVELTSPVATRGE